MIGLKQKKKKFSFYYLEENEIYTKYLSVKFNIINHDQTKAKNEQGKLHVCSKSVFFESDDISKPLYKVMFRNMTSDFQHQKDSLFDKFEDQNKIVMTGKKLVEIANQEIASPFLVHEHNFHAEIQPKYENIQQLLNWLNELFDLNKNQSFHFDLSMHVKQLMNSKKTIEQFDMTNLESVTEKGLLSNSLNVRRIMPLIQFQGLLYITDRNLYFQNSFQIYTKNIKIVKLNQVRQLYKRRYEFKDIGLEFQVQSKHKLKSYYYAFDHDQQRNDIYEIIKQFTHKDCIFETSLQQITQMWQNSKISNYEYLLHLNNAAYRSFSDLSQYPVFPWIIQNYNTEHLDLNDPTNYRDLQKPIGALNEKRLLEFLKRYQDMPDPKFLYGTHYSTPGYVIGYLVRQKPEYMLKLQSGRYDKPDRLFYSIKKDWQNVLNNPGSLKELIPQFFQDDPSFLVNYQKLDLGVRQKQKRVTDVKLPKWAKSPSDFLQTNRKALESKYVDQNLHHWIDLIFGYKQKGQNAINAYNLFHHISYEGGVDLNQISDPIQKKAFEVQISEFGQTPKQLFKIPHPQKGSTIQIPQQMSNSNIEIQNQSNHEHIQEVQLSSPILKYLKSEQQEQVKMMEISKSHKSSINECQFIDSKVGITVGNDGFLKVIDLQKCQIQKAFKITDFVISCMVVLPPHHIIVGSWDNNLYLFNIVYGSVVHKQVSAHFDSISCLLLDLPNQQLYSGSQDCTIKQWNIHENQLDNDDSCLIIDNSSQITCLVSLEPDSSIVFGDNDGNLFIFYIHTQQKVFCYNMDNEQVINLKSTSQFVAAITETQLVIFDQEQNVVFKIFNQEQNCYSSLYIEQNVAVVFLEDGIVLVYDVLQDKLINQSRIKGTFSSSNQLNTITNNIENDQLMVGTKTGQFMVIKCND